MVQSDHTLYTHMRNRTTTSFLKTGKKVEKKKNVCKVYHQIEMGLGASDEWSLKL